MRSYSALALLTAVITVCLGAQSDRSRQRSSPVRSVRVAANMKREADFDCPEEFGYYSHPTDCTLYYVCVFGGALLESCTGGLMYSHELQTCDWPRNVGCDGTGVVADEQLERLREEREPPRRKASSPRRTPPPPPPRAQPNPVVISRGQPKFNREQYEKQQQLYAEVDDLPPVDEIESDRQQRVYRGQPSTIGQVQKDRDGYISQPANSGRNLNSNIIPASLPQSSKFGSFSFGTQVDDRRTATATPAPQSYSDDKMYATDYQHDRQLDIEMNVIDNVYNDMTFKPIIRNKREVIGKELGTNETVMKDNTTKSDTETEIEYIEPNLQEFKKNTSAMTPDETDRGKRQVRYFLKSGYNGSNRKWPVLQPSKVNDFQHVIYDPNNQHLRYQTVYTDLNNNNNYFDTDYRPTSIENNRNTFLSYRPQNQQTNNQFKPSQADLPYTSYVNSHKNVGNHAITKSPPISSLNNNDNLFFSLAGGFYNNSPRQSFQNNTKLPPEISPGSQLNKQIKFPDSSLLPSSIVTGKPLIMPTNIPINNTFRSNSNQNSNTNPGATLLKNENLRQNPTNRPIEENYDNDDSLEYDESSSEEDENENTESKPYFPKPPYEFTHPNNKYANIENPFANPNFDFDVFLAKVSNGEYTPKPKPLHEVSTQSNFGIALRRPEINYVGMSTPKPFTGSAGFISTLRPNDNDVKLHANIKQSQLYSQLQQPQPSQLSYYNQKQSLNQNSEVKPSPLIAVTPLDSTRPKLNPPNFQDDRELPLTYSFSTIKPKYREESKQPYLVTQKPYIIVTGTGAPIIITSPKYQHNVKSDNKLAPQTYLIATSRPYISSSIKPSIYEAFKQSTQKPLTTIANDQLSALRNYWQNPSISNSVTQPAAAQPFTTPDYRKLSSLFAQAVKSSTQVPIKNHNTFNNALKKLLSTTTTSPLKRRPIPKPSPEMNDYYYDDDDDLYYYEPSIKPKYMPSTEVRPQRPPMAQNYKEYEDIYEEYEEDENSNIGPSQLTSQAEIKYHSYKPTIDTKNHNNISDAINTPLKNLNKNKNGKILVPVLVEYASARPSVLIRPEISNYEIIHHNLQNRTVQYKKPSNYESSPLTNKPPKYLNQTTLRPYTVRHRLAKPTTVPVKNSASQNEDAHSKGRPRHQNIVVQMKLNAPKDSYNQETRYSKIKHDDKTNSLEPTENVAPVSYSPSPRPKMLYNGSQNYNPDQYDPYYAVYDEDGELYKDAADYVQQYNVASLRPVVQQTYRGTPPPSRRPTENYTPRPVTHDDYDEALIQGQISNQNQYQSPVRHQTRGEGNELGYDPNPSSARTTLYEASSISTIPPTSSTSTTTTTTTTTQRSTTAQFTEAMTPSRYTPRLSSDEKASSKPEPSTNPPVIDPTTFAPSTLPSIVNFSYLAKPFEKTDNLYRLRSTLPTTETTITTRRPLTVDSNNNALSIETIQPVAQRGKKKVLSLTTGFSIRRNMNSTNNPYTLTLRARPLNEFSQLFKEDDDETGNAKQTSGSDQIESSTKKVENPPQNSELVGSDENLKFEKTSEASFRRKDVRTRSYDDYDIPIYTRPIGKTRGSSKTTTTMTSPLPAPTFVGSTTPIPRPLRTPIVIKTEPPATKYYLKTTSKRPALYTLHKENNTGSTENIINAETFIETADDNEYDVPINSNHNSYEESSEWEGQNRYRDNSNNPIISPYRTLDNLRKTYKNDFAQDYTTRKIFTIPTTTTSQNEKSKLSTKKHSPSRTKDRNSYYAYNVEDDVRPYQTTELFSGKVKHVIQAFLNNLVTSPARVPVKEYSSTTPASTTVPENERLVKIGFTKTTTRDNDVNLLNDHQEKPVMFTQEPSVTNSKIPNVDFVDFPTTDSFNKNFIPSTSTISIVSTPILKLSVTPKPIRGHIDSPKEPIQKVQIQDLQPTSKFNELLKDISEETEEDLDDEKSSSKIQRLFNEEPSSRPSNHKSSDIVTKIIYTDNAVTPLSFENLNATLSEPTDIASTTSTTKVTTTEKLETTTKTTTTTSKSISFPTRPSRVNPAIKLAVTNLGGGRRSYQSSSKCSTDNSLQANPKCNEIKYQRPTTTRGRGSAHYSKSGGSDAQQPPPNRGTPPTRSRPTLKPSTSIVTKTTEFVDIYTHPPSRPAPVYPQPTLDKTAAKCRKDVCLLPDCYCGGKEIPGDLPVESVPQIVLLTFDDSVNDLNKVLYADLFEKGRVNPNGCPISATFYVSHEWTDYSQVQNLYSAGHEMASHTISHSFGEQFSQKKWNREVAGQREILAAYGGVKLEDVRGMRAPFLSVGGNKMFKMLYDSNFTYDSSLPVYENKPPSWPYTLDYKLFHDCMIPPCPTKSYPGVWEVPMVMWQDLNGGRCSMGDACANPPEPENVYKMILKNFDRHYTTNRAPFGLFYHAAWFTQPHHKEGFIMFLDFINQMPDVWIITNWQALQWVRDPTPISRLNNFQPFQCNYQDRPKKCNNPKVCNLWHKSGVRYMRTCQPCPEIYPWTGKSGIRSSRIDNDNGE